MPNLVKGLRDTCKDVFKDKFLVVFIAIIAVVAINQIVFSTLLIDRNKAKAFTGDLMSRLFSNLGALRYPSGSTGVLLAEFWVPDPLTRDPLVDPGAPVCSYRLDDPTHTYTNPCITLVDADGVASAGPGIGVDRDGPEFFFQLRPDHNLTKVVLNNPGTTDQGLCTDSETAPACVYLDSDLNCNATDGAQTYILGAACGTAGDLPVVNIIVGNEPKLLWIHADLDNNGLYNLGEDIYIMRMQSDVVLQIGSSWGLAFKNQWFGDVSGAGPANGTPNAAGYIEADGDRVYKGLHTPGGAGHDPIILDANADSMYTASASFLVDADGGALAGATSGTGTDDDLLAPGTGMNILEKNDNVCVNTLPGPQFLGYYDGSDFADNGVNDGSAGANCIPGDTGTDVLGNSTAGLTMAQVIANYNLTPDTYPYSFINGAMFGFYADNVVADGRFTACDPNATPGCGAAETESLWFNLGDLGEWHPNIEGRYPLETDGAGNLASPIAVTIADDDSFQYGLTRGSTLTNLQVADNVCLGMVFFPFFGGELQIPEDIYVDGDGDCVPGSGGTDTILTDAHNDGLVVGSAGGVNWPYGGNWASAIDLLSYYDHAVTDASGATVSTPGTWDYCGNPAISPACPDNLISGSLSWGEGGTCVDPTPANWDPASEPLFDDVNGNGSYNVGEIVYWDPAGCIGGAAGFAPLGIAPFRPVFYNGVGTGDTACTGLGLAQDQVWNGTEPIWDDANNNRAYDSGETVVYDPAACLGATSGYDGYPIMAGEKYTESLWIDAVVGAQNYATGPDTDVYGLASGLKTGDHIFFGSDTWDNFNRPIAGPDSNLPADCDGDSLPWQNVSAWGGCTGINSAGTPLIALDGTENLCTDSLTEPTVIYIDGDGDCQYGSGGTDRLLRSDLIIEVDDNATRELRRVTTATLSVGTTWKFVDEIGGDGLYSCDPAPGNCDDLFYKPGIGTPTANLNFLSLIFMDANEDGIVSSTDTILQDSGNIIGGPAAYPNNKLDRWDISESGDMFSGATFQLTGTGTTADLANLKFCIDPWWLGTDGHCSPTVSTEDGLCGPAGSLVADPADPTQHTLKTNLPNLSFPLLATGCIYADIVGPAGNTISIQVPALVDANVNGLYDAGDQGMFMYSINDGPDAPVVLPYGIVITQPNNGGGGSPSISAPMDIKLVADSTGKVTITWQDPSATSLLKVLIQRDNKPTSVTLTQIAEVDKGVQIFIDSGLTPKQTYSYKLIAQSSAGPVSESAVYTITIPETGAVIGEPLPTPTQPGTPVAVVLPAGIKVGDLIKGTVTKSVYLVSSSGQRRAFPTEKIYDSWYADFSLIKVISDDTLSKLPLGPNMILRPGTWLMKINTDPKVYAVEPNGIIRWLETETVAKELYGTAWNKRIIDMPDVYFIDYEKGSNITTANYTTGSLLQYQGDTTIYYIENLTRKAVSTEAFDQAKFRTEFVLKSVSPTKFQYTDGTAFPAVYDFTMTMTKKNSEKVRNSLNSIFR